MVWCLGCLLPTTCAALPSSLSHSLATLGGPLLAPAGSQSGRKGLSEYSRRTTTGVPPEASGTVSGDQAAEQVTQDKYCPFVSAECRAQQMMK